MLMEVTKKFNLPAGIWVDGWIVWVEYLVWWEFPITLSRIDPIYSFTLRFPNQF